MNVSSKDWNILNCDYCRLVCDYSTGQEKGTHCLSHDVKYNIYDHGAHYCSEHECFHCRKHRDQCFRHYGMSVMSVHASTKSERREWANWARSEWKAEEDRMTQIAENMVLKDFVPCKTCGEAACICDAEKYDDNLVELPE